ncbi:diguanylate cyclase [Acidihalobacter yilgarnensis]|nr:diguanylate cyclase [Acidihalobacter yilgarnensis]
MPPELSLIVVDDMRFSRVVLEQSLRKIGYTDIRLAPTGAEALKMATERRADVILADWVMPGMSGLDLLDEIRRLDERRHWYTAVLLFTAKGENEALLEAFRRGVDDYLVKPPEANALAARVYGAGRIASLHNALLQTADAVQAANRELIASNQIDALTGLGNRRYLEQRIEAMLRVAQARHGGVCVALVAIDHFKRINERYSYDIGDDMLNNVALRLRNAVRPTDVITRHGEDTFAIAMAYQEPSLPRPDLFARLVETTGMRAYHSDMGDIEITVSVGAHCHHSDQAIEPLSTFIGAAEDNLAAAKVAGRNGFIYR